MEATLSDVSGVIGQIYQAAFDPAHWRFAIQGMRGLFGGSTACFTNHTTDKSATWAYSTTADEGYFRKYVEEYTDCNPFLDSLASTGIKAVLSDAGLYDVSEFRRSGFWSEWMKPQDMYSGLCSKIRQTQDSIMFVDVRRGARQSDFGSKDIELLTLLVPHFERASQINEQMRVADAMASTFSRLPFGAILVNSDLRVLQVNDLAQSWIDTGEIELKCRAGFLTAHPAILHQLHGLVADACAIHGNGVTGSGGHLTLEADLEADRVADYVIEVAPLFDSPFNDLAGGRCAILAIKKVHMGNPEGFDEYVRSIFSLTRSEARLAVLLAAGYSLKDAAAKVGVKNSTTRTYLEHLFRKTGTHQQSQLVALLKNVAPSLLSTCF